MKFVVAAAVAAGMLWLVDYHCSAGWGRTEEDICWAAVDSTVEPVFLNFLHIKWDKTEDDKIRIEYLVMM